MNHIGEVMKMTEDKRRLANEINSLSQEAYSTAWKNGFHDPDSESNQTGMALALIHSEISEALEALRKGNPSDTHCPEYKKFEIELADAVIRILDLAGSQDMDIGGAILEKMRYNSSRPYRHGKKF